MAKNILITGGTGYIGSNLIKSLMLKGYNVFSIFHSTNPVNDNDGVKWFKYDGSIESLLKINEKIDVILHLATNFTSNHSASTVDNIVKGNILLGVHLLEFAKEKGIDKFVNTSTYAQSIDVSSYNPQNFYTATKQAFEDILKFYVEAGFVNSITLSLYDTYGPNDNRPKFINLLLEAYKKDEVFNMSPGNQIIRYVFIEDVVDAFLLALELLIDNKITKSKTYSVYGGEALTLNELVLYVDNIMGKDLQTNPGFYNYRVREIMDSKPKFEKIPNWEAKNNLEIGIKKIIENEN